MSDVLVFILSCAGFTQILCYAKIFDKIRPQTGLLYDLLKCSMCVGFHVGYVIFFVFWYGGVILFPNFYLGTILYAALSSYTSYILDKLISDEGFVVYLKDNRKSESIYKKRFL